jgi:hypothetical protein
MKSPSIVLSFDYDVYLVLGDFQHFKVYRETDEARPHACPGYWTKWSNMPYVL